MDLRTLTAMSDELTKIAAPMGVGARTARWAGQHAVGIGKNIGRTVRDFRTPIHSMKAGWNADNRLWQAINVGSSALDAHSAMKKVDPSGKNQSRTQRMGAAVGSFAGGLIGNPHGLSGGVAGSLIGSTIGGAAGKVENRMVRVKRPVHPTPTPAPAGTPGQPMVAGPEGR